MKRLLLSLAILFASTVPSDVGAFADPAYIAGNFMLEIDGKSTGFVKSVGQLGYTRMVDGKVVGAGVPMPVEIQFGLSSRAQLNWVAGFLAGKTAPRDVQVVSYNYKLEAQDRWELPDFAITEVRFPALDGASKEVAHLLVRGQPGKLARTAASGKAAGEYGKVEQKLWLPANFRVTIDGLDATKINLLGPITVKKGKGGLEIVPFKLTMAQVTAASWFAWGEKTLAKGENDKRTLKIELLSQDRLSVLATLVLTGVTPLSMSYTGDKLEANSDSMKRAVFMLGAEAIKLSPPTKG